SSYAETFPLSEDIDLGNTWDALGVPSGMREQVIPDHVLPTDLHLKEEETARFDNPAYWPLSTIDAAQPYVEETFLKTQTSLQFDLNPQRTPQDSPLTSPLGTPSSGFPPSSYTPTLSSVSSGSPVPVTPPISITISESPQSLSPAFPVRHSREQYRLNPGLLIESILPRSADPSLRLHLYNILSSDWWYKNEREPRKEFVPFIKKHAAGSQRQFECLLCGKKATISGLTSTIALTAARPLEDAVTRIGESIDLRGASRANIFLAKWLSIPTIVSSRTAPRTSNDVAPGESECSNPIRLVTD
ncbi:2034_t:CDS:2, partial [Acaulospora colombiana]